jgi:hypothetical protein
MIQSTKTARCSLRFVLLRGYAMTILESQGSRPRAGGLIGVMQPAAP